MQREEALNDVQMILLKNALLNLTTEEKRHLNSFLWIIYGLSSVLRENLAIILEYPCISTTNKSIHLRDSLDVNYQLTETVGILLDFLEARQDVSSV